MKPTTPTTHADIEKLTAAVEATKKQAQQACDALRGRIESLRAERDGIDKLIMGLENILREMDPSFPEKLPPGVTERVSTAEAHRRRMDAGKIVYDTLAAHAPKAMSRSELDPKIPADMRRYWGRILETWNAANPTRKIKHNGGTTKSRQYYYDKKQ